MGISAMLGPVLGGAVAGAAAALITVSLMKSETKSQPAAAAMVEPETEDDEPLPSAELEARVLRLEQSVGGLARRALATPSGAAADAAAPAAVIDDPVFEAAVRDVVDRLQEERVAERELERGERRKQRADRWANDLAERLRLSEQQRTAVSEVAQRFYDQLRAGPAPDAGRLDRDARRARMDELRTRAEAELARVLDGAQLQSYRALPPGQQLGGNRGRRPPRE